METLYDYFINLIIVPAYGLIWMIFNKQNSQATRLAVVEAKQIQAQEQHIRETEQIFERINQIFTKLSSIEEALRK